MNEYRAFIKAMQASPEDTLIPLIFADWLDEHDQCERAKKIRDGTGGLTRKVTCEWEWFLRKAGEVAYHDPVTEWIVTDREPLQLAMWLEVMLPPYFAWWNITVDGSRESHPHILSDVGEIFQWLDQSRQCPPYSANRSYPTVAEAMSDFRAACLKAANFWSDEYERSVVCGSNASGMDRERAGTDRALR